MKITMKSGAHPGKARHYRLAPTEREVLDRKIEEFLARNWIEPSNSPWSSSALFVPNRTEVFVSALIIAS
jgi:hypothetical protein